MSKMQIILILFLLLCLYIFLNLGKFVDVTEPPKQADIIVSLGGDYFGCRLKTAVELYKKGYSKSGKFIYTGRDTVSHSLEESLSRKQYILKNGVNEKKIIHVNKGIIDNTMEEVLFIKKYMLHYNYQSVLFVSHPQHSRRISLLAQLIGKYEENHLNISIVSCNPLWWNSTDYYKNKIAFVVTFDELKKIGYNLIKYATPFIKYTSYSRNMKDEKWQLFIDNLSWKDTKK